MSHVRRAAGHDQLQLPAQRLASGRAGAAGARARPYRHRHRRPQHAGRRRAGLCGDQGILRGASGPQGRADQAAGRRPSRDARRLFAARLSHRPRRLQAAVAPADGRQPPGGQGRVRSHLRRSRGPCRGHSGHRPAAAPARRSRLPRAPARARPPVRRPLLSRRHHAVPRRRCAPPGAARQSRRRDGGRPGRHQRRALSRARTTGAARRGDGHSPGLHRRRTGLPPLRQRRAASQGARGDGAAVPPPSARHRAHAGDRRALPLLARSAHLPVSGRVRGRRDADGQARAPHLGGCRLALSRWRPGRSRQTRSGTSSS